MDRRSWLAWIAVLMWGCFSESPTADGGCRPGAAGCPCAGGQCDAALECVQDLDLCIPAGCDPGTELCTCHDGDCFGELRCDGGLCRPVDGTEGGTGGGTMGWSTAVDTIADDTAAATSESAETSAATTTTTMTTTDATTLTTTDVSTTAMTTDDTGMTQSTGGGETGVDGGPCHDCIINADESGNACEMALTGCFAGECLSLATCVTDCLDADDPLCIAGCCTMHPGGQTSYGDLATCWESECAMVCAEFTLHCGG